MLNYGLFVGLLASVASPPDTLVICSQQFQPALAPWIEHRSNQGHKFVVIEPQENFAAQRSAVRAACNCGTIKNLLIVGDGATPGMSTANLVPTELTAAEINVRYGSESEIATDFGFADVDGDRRPDLCVGRLPVRTSQELTQLVRKIIDYETTPSAGDWRRRFNLVAGTGRFSVIVDKVIETTAGRLISEMLPPDREVNLTYGSWRSQFCPPPHKFSQHTLASLNEGCCMWVYVGHGLPDQLDQVYVEDKCYPILADADLDRLDCRTGQPIAVLLACYTGAFDAPRPSVAERFLLQPGGPVAVLASSRVSMPYGNTVFGAELLRSAFDDKSITLGEVVRQAKTRLLERESPNPHRRMVEQMATMFAPNQADRDRERLEHAEMYNLLGDPLLRLNHPADLQLAAPPSAKIRSTIRVTGTAPCGGTLRCEWTVPNEQRLSGGKMRRELRQDVDAEREQTNQYAAANTVVLATATVAVRSGPFDADLTVPDLPPGRYVLRALLAENSAWATAATHIDVVRAVEPALTTTN